LFSGAQFAVIGMNGETLFKDEAGTDPLEIECAVLENLPDDFYLGQHAYWNRRF
jgi:hypothetical protein